MISVFEIIGPIMIGPSSSHTAGMARIGMMAHRIAGGTPVAVRLELSPMLRTTYTGHRTDAALFGGAIGLREDDPDIRRAIAIAHAQGVGTAVDFLPEGEYPQNTALLTIHCTDGSCTRVLGTSVGGGSIAISAVDGVSMNVRGDAHHLIVWSDAPLPPALTEGCRVQSGQSEQAVVSCLTFDEAPSPALRRAMERSPGVRRVSAVEPVLPYGVTRPAATTYMSCEEIIRRGKAEGLTVAEIAVAYEAQRSGHSIEEVRGQMHKHLCQIKRSVEAGETGNTMLYNLTGGQDGPKMLRAIREGKTISGGIVPQAIARALGVMEYNGAMGCIVAAPTAGSSGIVPGAVTTVQEHYGFSDDAIVDALFTAAITGVVMANRQVSFSGSVGGCQGEVGVSSAITAAGLTSLFTKDPETVFHAMAICLKNLLGLVCDPIAGPIEVPCIKRNAVGVANAFASSDMALAGIRSYIPPDEVIDALVDVERRLPQELKCATVGGLACTPTGCRLRERLRDLS